MNVYTWNIFILSDSPLVAIQTFGYASFCACSKNGSEMFAVWISQRRRTLNLWINRSEKFLKYIAKYLKHKYFLLLIILSIKITHILCVFIFKRNLFRNQVVILFLFLYCFWTVRKIAIKNYVKCNSALILSIF